MGEAYDVLTALIPLSTEALANSLDLEQLDAVRTVILNRIRDLEQLSTETGEGLSHLKGVSAAGSNQPSLEHPTHNVSSKKKKSRWDSDSEEEQPHAARKIKEPERKQPKIRRSLTNTTCRTIDAYSLERKLSEGTYGIVWLAVDLETKEYVAIKQIKFETQACKDGFPLAALREVNVLLSLRHPNIVHAREMLVGPRDDEDVDLEQGYPRFNVFMAMDYYQFDMRMILSELMTRPFHQSEVKLLMKQLLAAVGHMHDHWYMHRDLKPQNLLYGPGGRLVVCDFGLTRRFDDPPGAYTTMVVTLHYRSPELLLDIADYDGRGVDMWSVGCIFAELLTGRPVFHGTTEPEMLNLIWHYLGTPVSTPQPLVRSWPAFSKIMEQKQMIVRDQPMRRLREKIPPFSPAVQGPYLSETGMDLLERMLALDASNRISAAEALSHEWFTVELPKEKHLGEMPEFERVSN